MTATLPQAADRLILAIDKIKAAFGAPGDWGYNDPKGQALYELYMARAVFDQAVTEARDIGALDIAAAATEAVTPPLLREQFMAFADRHESLLLGLRWQVLLAVGDVRSAVADDDRTEMLRHVANALIYVAAICARTLKDAQGEPFSPARLALVAHDIAAATRDTIKDPLQLLVTAEEISWALRHLDEPRAAAIFARHGIADIVDAGDTP